MLEMFQLLFTVVAAEAAVVLSLVFGTPLRRVVVKGLDLFKQAGRGPLVAKTVAGTMLVLFGSVVFNVINIHRRVSESAIANTTDEIMFANRLLEASLMGFVLFLAMVIDRLHYYIRELQIARRNLEIAPKKTKST